MTTKTFGRRGAITGNTMPTARMAAFAPASGVETPEASRDIAPVVKERDLLDAMPLLTFGLIVFLSLIFIAQRAYSFDIDGDGDISIISLQALGAGSWTKIYGQGEVWRIFMAPLMHGSNSHLIGNMVALFFVGIRLEPMIGRGWVLFIFFASALGGEAGSLSGNPADIPGVGASGAISGLIGALCTQSFHYRVPPEERWPMMRTSLIFGVPAILPLFFSKSGNTDYFAHGAGALTGMTIAWAIGEFEDLQAWVKQAVYASCASIAISFLSCGFIAMGYSAYAREAALLIPSSQMPKDLKADAKQSVDLVARYPKDPMSHILRGAYLADNKSWSSAETELRSALTLAPSGPMGERPRVIARYVLALVLAEQGQLKEATTLAVDFCAGKYGADMRRSVEQEQLCGMKRSTASQSARNGDDIAKTRTSTTRTRRGVGI